MNNLIVSSLTLRMISDYNCTDNTDAMRLNMLAMELAGEGMTVEKIKNSIGYRTAQSNFNITDEYIKELLNQAEGIRSLKKGIK